MNARAQGESLLTPSQTAYQSGSDVAQDSGGRFVVSWRSLWQSDLHDGLRAQAFLGGQPWNSEFRIHQVSYYGDYSPLRAHVAVTENKRAGFVWTVARRDPNDGHLVDRTAYARIFALDF
ncbi:MAG: hypothetical protein RBU30_13615, partial [Polyangia bacterium]|nr:hypothetical protein [Polyangia bacterium]